MQAQTCRAVESHSKSQTRAVWKWWVHYRVVSFSIEMIRSRQDRGCIEVAYLHFKRHIADTIRWKTAATRHTATAIRHFFATQVQLVWDTWSVGSAHQQSQTLLHRAGILRRWRTFRRHYCLRKAQRKHGPRCYTLAPLVHKLLPQKRRGAQGSEA